MEVQMTIFLKKKYINTYFIVVVDTLPDYIRKLSEVLIVLHIS